MILLCFRTNRNLAKQLCTAKMIHKNGQFFHAQATDSFSLLTIIICNCSLRACFFKKLGVSTREQFC